MNLDNLFVTSLISMFVSGITTIIILPTKLAERMFSFRFEKRLSEFKSVQDELLEKLREQLSYLTDRGRRSNENEYAAIKTSWEAYVEAHAAIGQCAPSLVQYPNLDMLNDEELDYFLTSAEFSRFQIQDVKSSQEKNRVFIRILRTRCILLAHQKIYDARLTLNKLSPFIPEHLRNSMHLKLQKFAEIQTEQQIRITWENFSSGGEGTQATREFLAHGSNSFDEMLNAVRERTLREK